MRELICTLCGDKFEQNEVHICSYYQSKLKCEEQDVKQQHWYTQFKIQPVEFIMANKLNYCQGHAIKYICRYKEKGGKEDLLKAKNFIDYLIQELETGKVKP